MTSTVRVREWRAANPGRTKEQRRALYARNREEIKARSRGWSAANRERKAATSKAWAKANPDRVLNSRMKKFGLSASAYYELLASQDGKCAICGSGQPPGRGRFHVDHDHIAELKGGLMVVRGLLCGGCNKGLGCFRDNPESLVRASMYLTANSGNMKRVS
jgi:hypothetical protein